MNGARGGVGAHKHTGGVGYYRTAVALRYRGETRKHSALLLCKYIHTCVLTLPNVKRVHFHTTMYVAECLQGVKDKVYEHHAPSHKPQVSVTDY